MDNPFVACVVCGEMEPYLSMFTCIECEEPICKLCFSESDGFCSDDCRSFYDEAVNGSEDWGDIE